MKRIFVFVLFASLCLLCQTGFAQERATDGGKWRAEASAGMIYSDTLKVASGQLNLYRQVSDAVSLGIGAGYFKAFYISANADFKCFNLGRSFVSTELQCRFEPHKNNIHAIRLAARPKITIPFTQSLAGIAGFDAVRYSCNTKSIQFSKSSFSYLDNLLIGLAFTF